MRLHSHSLPIRLVSQACGSVLRGMFPSQISWFRATGPSVRFTRRPGLNGEGRQSHGLRLAAILGLVSLTGQSGMLGGVLGEQTAMGQAIITLAEQETAPAESAADVSKAAMAQEPVQEQALKPVKASEPNEKVSVQSDARALSRAFRQAARAATPSVVTVYSYGQNLDKPADNDDAEEIPPGDETLGPTPPPKSEDDGFPLTGLGSGVIVNLQIEPIAGESKEADNAVAGYWVMTNNHVINDARRVVVQLPDETELVATVVHGDPDSDIAVLRLETDLTLDVATLGDSDRLEIGDWVLAIGSPFKLEATVSAGIISAKNRALDRVRRGRLLQTDAAINPGNSGGPLIDLEGEVIAISTAIATRNGGYQGIGFAVPVNQARWIARELAQFERVRRAAMGIRLAELNPKNAKKLSLPTYLGVLVYQVIDDSAAQRAGLQNMDVILEFAGQRVRKPGALQEAVERQPVGSTQQIKIYRAGEELIKEIVLAPLEDPTAVEGGSEEGSEEEAAGK
ncbi:S1C family serine protease [Neorhodopirellula lusitana]|uniref:S1C family serine protease n=1 Tax=Neorhodopirellula lusitana TaxID=445327 RepID=UPI00384DA16B